CAAELDSKSRRNAWDNGRATANAVFLRGFDAEILQEMKGIAAGAADAGAKYEGRSVDLLDIVASNTITELGLLAPAADIAPNGLEGLHFQRPNYFDPKRDVPVGERCSAFCATGPATKDGKMVIAHLTMWPLTLAEQTNLMLDIQPTKGHRVLMQSYPGGIQSGTDWYQNDAGVVLTETTIRQSPFNIQGTPVANRARKAIQYGDNIDLVVKHLGEKNNGLYTNEWMIGDAKNNEIAMYELGTYKTHLYRSSKNEWFGNTPGFYWGCNNAKDLDVRLEYAPDPNGEPAHIPFTPAPRDIKWQQMYSEHKGSIDEQFAFLAMRTPPLVSSTTMDAKVATADMASHFMTWAAFGKPNQREWVPNERQRETYSGNTGIYASGYRLIEGNTHDGLREAIKVNEAARLASTPAPKKDDPKAESLKDKLWKGWILPASDGDLWLSLGATSYYEALQADDPAKGIDEIRVSFRAAASEADQPLASLTGKTDQPVWARLAASKGALLIDAVRQQMGDDQFFPAMSGFFATHTTKQVTTAEFQQAMTAAAGKTLDSTFSTWLNQTGLPGDTGGPGYLSGHISRRLATAVIVYGTLADAGANRYAAEQLQTHLLSWYESEVPIRKDFEVAANDLRDRDVIFIGRPEANSALKEWQEGLALDYAEGVFKVGGTEYAHEGDGLLFTAVNPLNPKRMVLVLAGNSALETVRLAEARFGSEVWAVYREGKQKKSGVRY
ncbi:MAG: M1 family aminopeptidase, partial [Bryobacteraceae bacterium]